MGIIEAVDPREGTVTVRSEDRRLVYSGEALRELELAYAITIHKSQGSEFAAVVIPLFEVPPRLCYRNLLYTASRARKICASLRGMPPRPRPWRRTPCATSAFPSWRRC